MQTCVVYLVSIQLPGNKTRRSCTACLPWSRNCAAGVVAVGADASKNSKRESEGNGNGDESECSGCVALSECVKDLEQRLDKLIGGVHSIRKQYMATAN